MEQLMASLSQSKKNAEMEKNLPPTPVVLRDRDSQIYEGARNRRLFERPYVSEMKGKLVKTTYMELKDYSKEPIDNLSRVRFRDMQVRLVHKGKYVLCRTVSLPIRVVAIEVNVEDPSGDVLLLTVYNFPLPFFANMPELDGIFPIGTLLAIREPYLKTRLLDASGPFIRVDSPTDIIFINDQSNLLQDVAWKFPSPGPQQPPHVTALEYKVDGNKKFQGKLWLSATIAYTNGLLSSPSHDLSIDLRLNRSEAYLKLGYFSAALEDAQVVLSDKTLPQCSIMFGKALLKAGKANYFQDNFKEAFEFFMQLKNIPDGIAEAETWINKTHLRIAEQHNGEYDWYKMFKNSEVVHSRLDVADYLGPIEVRNLGSCGHGRGMVASRDVSPGELLLVCKPFVSVFPEEIPENSAIYGFNATYSSVSTTSQVVLMHKCIQKIYGNPSMKNLVYDLYVSAPHLPSPDLYLPDMGSEKLHEPLRTSINIDVSRVENICSMNMFSPASLDSESTREDDSSVDTPSALYLLPSMFNHSCQPNTHHFFLRDVMVVRAISKIFKGDEVFVTYAGLRTYKKRSERLKKWGFSCQCQLCQDDRKDGADARAERERLGARIEDAPASNFAMKRARAKIEELEKQIKTVKTTYAASRRTFKVSLAHMHGRLAWEFENLALETNEVKHYYRAIEEHIQALKALGIPVTDDSIKKKINSECRREPPIDKEKFTVAEPEMAVMITLALVPCFFALRDEIRAERWFRAALLIDDISIGGGREVFNERHGMILSAKPFVAITTNIKDLK